MKYLMMCLLFLACSNDAAKIKEAESTGPVASPVVELKSVGQPSPEMRQGLRSGGAQNQIGSQLVEQNESCICTKDWKPVCGSNGQTYPNACQAKCDKAESFTDGNCAKE
jgi:hypothetical protein